MGLGIGVELCGLQQMDDEMPSRSDACMSTPADSAAGFPKASDGAFQAGLSIGKGKLVDSSVQIAYITAIRRAQRYLYIENQVSASCSCSPWNADFACLCSSPCVALVCELDASHWTVS